MSTTTSTARVEGDVAALRAPTLAWALRRTALAVVILVVAIGFACLLYASIDPDEDSAPVAKPVPHAVPSNSTGHAPEYSIAPRRV